MYHSGSPGDLALVGLALVIFVFWIGVWALHCVSIMYGKWRLYRSTTIQIPGLSSVRIRQQQQQLAKDDYASNETLDDVQHQRHSDDESGINQSIDTIIQVENVGDQQHFTLFSGGLLPGVSILKPLVGIDQYLMINLESFFTMAYPRYELLFCVPDESDPAIMVVQSLMNKYPTVDARIFIGGENVGVNPKINNMMPGYRASVYDLLLISDSAIMMRDDTLLDMVSTMVLPDLDRDQPKRRLHRAWDWIRNRGPSHGVGLVHQMPFCLDREEFGFPACLEKVFFGAFFARIYLAADCFGVNCCTGMSALMRKSLLESKGGLSAFGCYLAEDQFISRAITEQGWRTSISSQPAWQNSSVCQLSYFQDRLERWTKLRFAMMPFTTLVEPFQECVLLGVLASLAISFLFGLSVLGVFLVHMITWFLLDWTLLNTIQRGRLSFSKLDFIVSWLFRECTCTAMFIKSLLSPRIQWKNGYYRLQWGGLAEIIKSPEPPAHHFSSLSSSSNSSVASSTGQSVSSTSSQNLASSNRNLLLLQQQTTNTHSSGGDLLAFTPAAKVTDRPQSRHVRSRSLPQKNPVASLFHNLSSKLYARPSSQLYSSDDLMAKNYPFHVTKSERDIF